MFLRQGAILWTNDAAALYHDIPNSQSLISLWRVLELRDNRKNLKWRLYRNCWNSSKNNIFDFDETTFKLLRGTATRIKFAPPYAVVFLADLEEKILKTFEEKTDMMEGHTRHLFIRKHGEESLEKILNKLKSFIWQ